MPEPSRTETSNYNNDPPGGTFHPELITAPSLAHIFPGLYPLLPPSPAPGGPGRSGRQL